MRLFVPEVIKEDAQYEVWFAWHPVWYRSSGLVWLEHIERKRLYNVHIQYYWDYRDIPHRS